MSRRDLRWIMVLLGTALSLALFAGFTQCWRTLRWASLDAIDYAERVPALLAKGKTAEALRTARTARERYALDPAAGFTYAQALEATENHAAANRELEAVLQISSVPASNPEGSRPTLKPFFFPAARYHLGERAFAAGNLAEAVEQFELGSAFSAMPNEAQRKTVAAAFAKFGLHERALTLDPALPIDNAFAALAKARRFALESKWAECRAAAEQALKFQADLPEAYCLWGVACIALEAPSEAERFLSAAAGKWPGATWYLGRVQEKNDKASAAIEAYLSTPQESIYRPFAVTAALRLLETGVAAKDADPAALREERDRLLQVWTQSVAQSRDAASDTRLLSARFEPGVSAETFPAAFAWRLATPANAAEPVLRENGPLGIMLHHGANLIELRFVQNLLPFGDFARAWNIPGRFIGWPERCRTPRDAVESGLAASAQVNGATVLKVTNPDPQGQVLCGSTPLAVTPGARYLLAVRCKSDPARLNAGWSWYDGNENVVYTYNIMNQTPAANWVWTFGYERCRESAQWMQVVVGLYQEAGAALFEQALVIPLEPPVMSGS